jgi:hypothetical protein
MCGTSVTVTDTRLRLSMDQIDVDEIAEVNYLNDTAATVEVKFKDGRTERYNGSEHPEVFDILNHWTPPTA